MKSSSMKKNVLITVTAAMLMLGSVSVFAADKEGNTARPCGGYGCGQSYSTSRPQNPKECPYYDENRNCINGENCLGPGKCFRQTNVSAPVTTTNTVANVQRTAGSTDQNGKAQQQVSGKQDGTGYQNSNGKRNGSGSQNGNGKHDGSGSQSGNGKHDGSGRQNGNGKRDGSGSQNGTGKHDGSGPRGQNGTCRK